MYYAGIDYHKRYSIVSIQTTQGQIVREQRVEHAFPELFGGLYRHHRSRGKQANTAIPIVARRMCHIAYQLLTEDRMYKELPFSPAALAQG